MSLVEFFEIKASFEINKNDFILNKLYSPIIGTDAIKIYNYFYIEYMFNNNNLFINKNHDDLLKSIEMDFQSFENARKKLESIGLLKTLVRPNQNENNRIYYIFSTLTYENLINNPKINQLLINNLSDIEYKKMKYIFENSYQNENMIDISESIDYLLTNIDLQKIYKFNFTKLNLELMQNFKTNINISQEIKEIIESHFNNNGLNFDEILSLLSNSIIKKQNNLFISENIFKEKIQNEIEFKKEQEKYKIIKLNRKWDIFIGECKETESKKIINDYKKYNCNNYFVSATKTNITFEIQNMFNELKNKYFFNDDVINAIVDYSLYKNNAKIVCNYILKIAKTIYTLSIDSCELVIDHFKKIIKKKPFINLENSFIIKDDKQNKNDEKLYSFED